MSPLMTEVVWPFDEDIVPIDEAAVAQNHDLIDAIINAEVSGPVMTPDEFKAWLDQQHANPIFAAARRNPRPLQGATVASFMRGGIGAGSPRDA